jgi:D-alanyl-D-alanine carboxypeptidase
MVDAARRFESGPEFVASLPLGGLDGTLEERMAGATPVRAKTGHLDGVSALCGMVPSGEGGGRRFFALLVNGARGSAEDVDASLDRFVASVAETAAAQGAVGE